MLSPAVDLLGCWSPSASDSELGKSADKVVAELGESGDEELGCGREGLLSGIGDSEADASGVVGVPKSVAMPR